MRRETLQSFVPIAKMRVIRITYPTGQPPMPASGLNDDKPIRTLHRELAKEQRIGEREDSRDACCSEP